MEITLLTLSLVLIVIMLLTIIFLGIRCKQYRKAWRSLAHKLNSIISDDYIDEAIATLALVYHMDEDEVVRRLTNEHQADIK